MCFGQYIESFGCKFIIGYGEEKTPWRFYLVRGFFIFFKDTL